MSYSLTRCTSLFFSLEMRFALFFIFQWFWNRIECEWIYYIVTFVLADVNSLKITKKNTGNEGTTVSCFSRIYKNISFGTTFHLSWTSGQGKVWTLEIQSDRAFSCLFSKILFKISRDCYNLLKQEKLKNKKKKAFFNYQSFPFKPYSCSVLFLWVFSTLVFVVKIYPELGL